MSRGAIPARRAAQHYINSGLDQPPARYIDRHTQAASGFNKPMSTTHTTTPDEPHGTRLDQRRQQRGHHVVGHHRGAPQERQRRRVRLADDDAADALRSKLFQKQITNSNGTRATRPSRTTPRTSCRRNIITERHKIVAVEYVYYVEIALSAAPLTQACASPSPT